MSALQLPSSVGILPNNKFPERSSFSMNFSFPKLGEIEPSSPNFVKLMFCTEPVDVQLMPFQVHGDASDSFQLARDSTDDAIKLFLNSSNAKPSGVKASDKQATKVKRVRAATTHLCSVRLLRIFTKPWSFRPLNNGSD